MRESPRLRRLRNDLIALERLASESSIFSFRSYGTPPDFYMLSFKGRGFWRPEHQGDVQVRDEHEVHVRLGASYPRMMPELSWKSPVFHPNVSATGIVCLGGYGTYWVPSLSLDELCGMLWDMIRYDNFDETSPYNREAAAWAKHQTLFRLPIDGRPLRDKLAATTLIDGLLPPRELVPPPHASHLAAPRPVSGAPPRRQDVPPQTVPSNAQPPATPDVLFLGEVIQAEAVPTRENRGASDILYIE